ncbi:hypothetical protein O1R50_24040 [Glycomyces luteolus]|uniref:Uncharacterized protein n=1 Tax=Glycomyces luteolus TaxID=2670330 RepID=A0A9X3SVN7_9ACTN|nr:hypothetical protein [Glycomyces luteolus]MDA1362713.1 hypothetical protein [Glycomyces luteolus]
MGRTVDIRSDIPEVPTLLRRELGAFFQVESGESSEIPRLAAIEASAEIPAVSEAREQAQRSSSGHPILLHSGSHSYDLRRGLSFQAESGTLIHSADTGSWILADPGSRRIRVANPDPANAASDVRRVVRDLLFIPWLESMGGLVVHGAAILGKGDEVTLVLGDRGAGKTTFFMAGAGAGGGEALSCERLILVPGPSGIQVLACPERISTFAGTLRSFPGTEHLSGAFDETTEWTRAAKIRVHWQDMFACLGLVPRLAPAYLSRLVFPTYNAKAPLDVADLDFASKKLFLEQHVVTGRDVNRPDWLGWFAPQSTEATLLAAARLPATTASWRSLEDVSRILGA